MEEANGRDVSHFLQVFGTPNGHRVLKDLLDIFDNPTHANTDVDMIVKEGHKQVISYILDALKQASKDKKTYANILFEVYSL